MAPKNAKSTRSGHSGGKARQDLDSDDEFKDIPLFDALKIISQRQRELDRERPKQPLGFDTAPAASSEDFSAANMPDHPIQVKPPPDNIADDPYRVNDPWGVKDSNPVIDRGEIWQVIDDPEHRKAGIKEWEQAQRTDPSAKPEDLYPEAPDFLAMPRPEYHERKVDELFKHRDARRYELIKDADIHDAIKAGPAVVDQLRDWERRWILDKEGGIPPKRPITAADLDALYANYTSLLGAPGHKFPGCKNCEQAVQSKGKFAYYTHKVKSRDGGETDEAWHYRDNHEAKPVDRACKKFLKALVGFHQQAKKAERQAPIIAANIERASAGKKPIPLNETRVERLVRELDEGTLNPPPASNPPEIETETADQTTARQTAALADSAATISRLRASEDTHRLATAWQRYRTHAAFQTTQKQSAADILSRPLSVLTNLYPCGLPYNGRLIYNRDDIGARDWLRFRANSAAFEEEEGRKLEEGSLEREQWERFIGNVLQEYMPERGVLTEEPKATYLETLFSKMHMEHLVDTPL